MIKKYFRKYWIRIGGVFVFISVLFALKVIILFKVYFKDLFIFHIFEIDFFRTFFEDIDLAGFIVGVAGIYISLLITYKINEANNKELETNKNVQLKFDELLSNIQEVTNNNHRISKDILAKESHFKSIDNINDLINSIHEIYNFSSKNLKKLYIMNHSASFGYLIGFKLSTILAFKEKTTGFSIKDSY